MVRSGFHQVRYSHLLSALLLTPIALLPASSTLAQEAIAPASSVPAESRLAQTTPNEAPLTLIDQVLQQAAADLGIPQAELGVLRYSQETWRDGCLGLGSPVELCAAVLVDGWQFEVVHGDQSWFYRTNLDGSVIRRSTQENNLPPSVGDRLLQTASEQLGIPLAELSIIQAEPRVWNGCMGIITSPDQVCTEIGILGWRAIVQRPETGEQWFFHLDGNGSDIRLNPTPELTDAVEMPPMPLPAEPETIANWLDQRNSQIRDAEAVQAYLPTEDLLAWLQTARQRGMNPADVQSVLQSAGWQSDAADFQEWDLDGDGRDEWLVTIRLAPDKPLSGRSGDFWIIGDRPLYRFFQPEDYFYYGSESDPIPLSRDFFLSAPQVAAIQDYTGDRTPEILLQRNICGAHTCTQSYTVLSYQDGEMVSLIERTATLDADAQSVVMPYSELRPATDYTGDDVPDLVLYGGVIGSAGAGIQRPRTEIWAWDGTAIRLTDTEWDDTDYRFHVLYEANYRFQQGDRDRAQALYQQVIEDDSLNDDLWWNASGSTYDSSREFAAFRLMLMGLLEGDRPTATQWQSWLGNEYPGTAITEAAQQLMDLTSNQTSLETACATVSQYLESLESPQDNLFDNSGPTGPLRYMGYGNPELTGADVCPLADVTQLLQTSAQ
jgi:hypothetical protein